MKLRQVLAGVLSALLLFVQVGIPVYAENRLQKKRKRLHHMQRRLIPMKLKGGLRDRRFTLHQVL